MGSPLDPLMANVFMCHLEEKLTRDGLMPHLYKRYVDDTLAKMPIADTAAVFLSTLNGLHPSLSFTMDLPVDNKIPFFGYTARHLHQRIAEHKNSAIGRLFLEAHGNNNLLKESQFRVLRKCQGKFDCLVFEMLFIKNLMPNLNTQTDSIRAKLFV